MSRVLGPALIAAALPFLVGASEPPAPPRPGEEAALQFEKLKLEVAQLREGTRGWWTQPWFTVSLGIVTGAVSGVGSFLAARRSRLAALDQAVHEKRLEAYPKLVNACHQLALYFPDYTSSAGGPAPGSSSGAGRSVSGVAPANPAPPAGGAAAQPGAKLEPRHCEMMGRALSRFYFDGGGLLLSKDSRECYFALTTALTRAAKAQALEAPVFPDDAEDVSDRKMTEFRTVLYLMDGKSFKKETIASWTFGPPNPNRQGPDHRADQFKDYVCLQLLSSRLRTSLAEDLRSRRRPT
jgi:hypothetical protein